MIREVTTTPYELQVSPAQIDMSGSTAQTQIVAVSANFAEPFPYSVQVSASGGTSWLSANRVTGLTGESIKVSVNPAGLAPGTYHGIVSIIVYVPVGGSNRGVDIPVSLTVP